MGWPTPNEFQLAFQHPLKHFCRPELKRGQAALDDQGLPRVHSGSHLDVYELRGAGSVERWAIGCFTRPPHGLVRRFLLVNEHLQKAKAVPLVETEYIEQGICVRGRWYPITRSRWVEGQPLNAHVRQYLDHPDELRLLASAWVQAATEMGAAGIAHGNLRPETALVSAGHGGSLTLRFVDYDRVYVPTLTEPMWQSEAHADLRHPQWLDKRPFGVEMDRFSHLVVLAALYAAAVEGRGLWERFDTGHNMLFRQSDFEKPGHSPLLATLWQSESSTVRTLTGLLILAAIGPIEEVPSLDSVTKHLRPGAGRVPLQQWQIDQVSKLMESGVRLDFNIAIEEAPVDPVATAVEEREPEVGEADLLCHAIQKGTSLPPKHSPTPPPLPVAGIQEHPNTQTYQLDAWMPEEVAIVKLQGFVKDTGGKMISNLPGYIKVHLLDERDLARPRSPAWLARIGLAKPPPATPRVRAVLELNLVHKPTPTRQLVGITMRLVPGPDDDISPRWRGYCDKMFCNLRGYLMGMG